MMYSMMASIAMLASILPATVLGLGINCRGNDFCTNAVCTTETLSKMRDTLQAQVNAGRNDHFRTGDHISCYYNPGNSDQACCAFFQTAGASGSTKDALQHIKNLLAHGCRICGSDPTKPGNDVSKGQLTVNNVNNAGPNGCLSHYCD